MLTHHKFLVRLIFFFFFLASLPLSRFVSPPAPRQDPLPRGCVEAASPSPHPQPGVPARQREGPLRRRRRRRHGGGVAALHAPALLRARSGPCGGAGATQEGAGRRGAGAG